MSGRAEWGAWEQGGDDQLPRTEGQSGMETHQGQGQSDNIAVPVQAKTNETNDCITAQRAEQQFIFLWAAKILTRLTAPICN